MKKLSSGTTPVPNAVFDHLLPKLTDGELRILLVLIRATLGWVTASGGRKHREWLTHSELKRRSGRSSSPVSKAVDSLQKRGVITVHTEDGRLLPTAASRRGAFGRLYLALDPSLSFGSSSDPRFQKVGTTKEKQTKEKPINRKGSDAAVRIGGWHKADTILKPPGSPDRSMNE